MPSQREPNMDQHTIAIPIRQLRAQAYCLRKPRRPSRLAWAVAVAAVLAPAGAAVAAWWNPFSWFDPPMRPLQRSTRAIAIQQG